MQRIIRKSLLYKSGVEYADYCINHVEGCSHGCTYPCYAMLMKKRCGIIKNYKEWIRPKIVSNALELLDLEIPKYKKDIKYVYLCFSTDPFMYKQKEVVDLSLEIIKRLNEDNIKVVTISKGIYPKILTKKNIYGRDNEYGSTIITLSEKFRRSKEPFAVSIEKRVKTLKFLHNKGLKTWVSMEPYPTPNLIEQDLTKILEKIAFVDKIVFGRWNYNALTTYFDSYKTFYNDCAYRVIKFCEEKGIEYHIKEGTVDRKYFRKSENYTNSYKKVLSNYCPA
ncbi:hypothetical protein LCGC14_0101920 [marine sediment metagenome]|uniref:Radical SAM core domain-containing protein n=1 Tax=marine sediment metagenome TaxID=412755 RepID=A0A0F9VS23_9ZZZZ